MKEKSHLQSKKFVASAVWSLCWLIILGLAIHEKLDSQVLLAIIYMNGMVQGLYLGGQSFVDAFVRRGLSQFSSNAAISPIHEDKA
jgi:hypothetical protein